MTLDLAAAVGHRSPDQSVSWNQRDLLLYSLGIGAKGEDFPYVYELDKSWAPFPTYPIVLSLKGDDADVNLFAKRMAGPEKIPGLPTFDPNRVVHASQSIELLKPLPAVSGPGWKFSSKISAIHENKSGIILERESILLDPSGTAYAKLYSAYFNIGAKATGKKFSKVIAGAPAPLPIPKDRKPDYVIRDTTTPEQAVLYRLSGDYNPLHIDPAIGRAGGFGGTILHGPSTLGFAARAVIAAAAPGDPQALRLLSLRFTSPVRPGDALETGIWEAGAGPDGTVALAFETLNVATGKTALGGGLAYVKRGVVKSKL